MVSEKELRQLLRFHRWMHTKQIEPANFWRTHMRRLHLDHMRYHRERAHEVIAKLREIRNDQRHAPR